MRSIEGYPFNRLRLPPGETALFETHNLTFHRSIHYGVAVTASAVYWYSPFMLMLGRWKRYPLDTLTGAGFVDARWFPRLVLHARDRIHVLRTLHDTYEDERQWDRRQLAAAAEFIEKRISVAEACSEARPAAEPTPRPGPGDIDGT